MSDSSAISYDNDQRGWAYQQYVADYIQEKTGVKAIIKDTHGTDVVCGELKFEVKGTRNLYQELRPKNRNPYFRIRGWKADQKSCPEEITHFVFVLDEQYLCSYPLIYVVPIKDVRARFEQYSHTQWVVFPLHWVWDHYDSKLSKIPSLNLNPKELLEILNALHSLEGEYKATGHEGLETEAINKITAFVKQTGATIYD